MYIDKYIVRKMISKLDEYSVLEYVDMYVCRKVDMIIVKKLRKTTWTDRVKSEYVIIYICNYVYMCTLKKLTIFAAKSINVCNCLTMYVNNYLNMYMSDEGDLTRQKIKFVVVGPRQTFQNFCRLLTAFLNISEFSLGSGSSRSLRTSKSNNQVYNQVSNQPTLSNI